MTLVAEEIAEDVDLTALARRVDQTACVVVAGGTWWLIDELGRLALGTDRLAAALDLAQYLELLERALGLYQRLKA